MRTRWLWLILPGLLFVIAPAARCDDKADVALEKLQGSWKILSYKNDGKDESPRPGTEMLMIVDGSKYSLKRNGKEAYRGDLKIDAPGKITATLFDPKDKKLGEAMGIYKLDGDDMTICWDEETGDRPTAFTSETDSKDRLIVLKKGK